MNKGRFHARIWAKLLRHESRLSLLPRGARVLAAVSGGPDSACLADFLCSLRLRRGLVVTIAHFDHGLRPSSRKDAAFVEALGERLEAPVIIEKLDVRGAARRERRSLEDAGRALRYRALAALARKTRSSLVATGHQQDDQAETVLLHLLRGTSPAGLAGIPARRPLGRPSRSPIEGRHGGAAAPPAAGVEVVRPLLCLTRSEVLEYLRYRGLRWRVDPTNRSRKFLRNWVRLDLLPRLETRAPGLGPRLATMAEAIGSALRSPSTPAAARRARGRSPARPRRGPRGGRWPTALRGAILSS